MADAVQKALEKAAQRAARAAALDGAGEEQLSPDDRTRRTVYSSISGYSAGRMEEKEFKANKKAKMVPRPARSLASGSFTRLSSGGSKPEAPNTGGVVCCCDSF